MRLSRNFALGWQKQQNPERITHSIPARVVLTRVLNSLRFSVKLCVLCGQERTPSARRLTIPASPSRQCVVPESQGHWPVRPWCVPDAVLAARTRTVTGGLTSPARPVTWGGVRKTTSGVLNTVSPSQGEAGMAKTTKSTSIYTHLPCTRRVNTSAEFPVFLCETLCALWLKRNSIRAPFRHPSFALPTPRMTKSRGH
jgi:hypothetical protein